MKSKEYFKFIINGIENDLKNYNTSGEILKCLYVIGVLKSSENLLKDIYTISRIKNLKNLGNYLLFVLKKAETDEIKFDNLLENINLDKEFIFKELVNSFDIGSSSETIEKKGKGKKMSVKKESNEEKISSEIKRILAESKFKVEEIDNELVTEEFIESETKEDNDFIVRGNYLELLQPDNGFEDASVFSLPTDNLEKEEIREIENDVFSLPIGESNKETEIPAGDILAGEVNTEELEEVKLEKIVEGTGEKEIKDFEEGVSETESDEDIKTEKVISETKEQQEILEPIKEEENLTSEQIHEKDIETGTEKTLRDIEVVEEPAIKTTEDTTEREEVDEIAESIEIAEVENSVYMKYETELLTSNVLLRNNLGELGELNPDDENYLDRKNILLREIVDSSTYMGEYSKKMSFEVITGIYSIMNMTFSTYGKTVGKEIITLFKDSINLVESLIKGEDFAGYDNVMKSLDVLKSTLLDIKREESKEPKTIIEAGESDENITRKEYDNNDRQKLSILKQNIIEVENVFKSIEDIKGKFQAYEALRRLSHTFAHLKELVNVANSLDMRKLAQLAEASYIFVKFIQNYRMNPFESEITEVFKYIIYNFKLIFLDKPTKDIDLLISYLNDPVKIFEKKEKK